MARVSAEARGRVRVGLGELDFGGRLPTAVMLETVDPYLRKVMRKRLSDHDLVEASDAVVARLPRHRLISDRFVYLSSCRAKIQGDGADFEEQDIMVRAVALAADRRRLSYADYPLGLFFSFHCLCRLVERGASSAFLEQLLDQLPSFVPLSLAILLVRPPPRGNIQVVCRFINFWKGDSDPPPRGNIQVVCRFINFWKGDSDNDEFQRLLVLVSPTEPSAMRSPSD